MKDYLKQDLNVGDWVIESNMGSAGFNGPYPVVGFTSLRVKVGGKSSFYHENGKYHHTYDGVTNKVPTNLVKIPEEVATLYFLSKDCVKKQN